MLKSKGINILWVGHCHLGRYRRGKGLPNKSDPADALAMAGYYFDPDNQTDDGEANPRKYLIHQSEIVKKALWQYIHAAIEPTKLRNGKPRPPITEDARILTDARDEFLKQKDLSGKHRASKLASKFANLIYKELIAVFCR